MKDALATPPNDGCLRRTASTDKDAGAVVYLVEELGDARLRCDQLVRYLSEGVKLIETSSHKDHFFEVAGHLIHAIPTTTFKLQKALQAVALAASRIDYEELKRELRPEKVQELEKVLEDVRIRQVQRRSGPLQNLTTKRTAEYMRALAQMSREAGGVMPYTALASLIVALEDRTKEASEPAGDMLDKLAESLERAQGDDQAPSRTVLAAVLRRMLGDANVEGYEAIKEAESDMRAASWKAERAGYTISEDEKKRTRFEEGKPADPTKDMSPEEAKEWKANTEKYKDKFKKDADWKVEAADEEKRTRFEEGKPADPTKNMSKEEKAEWEANTKKYKDKFKKDADWKVNAANDWVAWVEDGQGRMVHFAGPSSRSAMQRMLRNREWERIVEDRGDSVLAPVAEAKRELNSASSSWWFTLPSKEKAALEKFKAEGDKKAADWKVNAAKDPIGLMERIVKSTKEQLKQMEHSLGLYKKDSQKYAPQLDNFKSSVRGMRSVTRMVLRGLGEKLAEDDKRTMFEKGKPADPTKEMSKEEAAEWEANTKKYKDKFKKDADWKANKSASQFGRGVTPDKLAKQMYDAANLIYDSRGKTRDLGQLLRDSDDGQPFGEGPLAGADSAVLKRVDTAKKELHKWDIQGSQAAGALEAAARDVKRMPEYVPPGRRASDTREATTPNQWAEATKILDAGFNRGELKWLQKEWDKVDEALQYGRKRAATMQRSGVGTTENGTFVKYMVKPLRSVAETATRMADEWDSTFR